VMLGSVGHPFDAAELHELGIVGFATKPVWRQQLVGILHAALGERGGYEAPGRPGGTTPVREVVPARVLLVEDSIVNAEVTAEILRHGGHSFVLVENGLAAVEAASQGGFDVVLMDLQLPGIDGYEATRRIRALEANRSGRRTRIIALTASATTGDMESCLAAGMDDYVAKPVDAARLLQAIGSGAAPAIRAPQPSGPTHESGVADLESALQRLQGNHALLARIIGQFAEAAPAARAQLQAAVMQRDAPTAAYVAHRLRGQAATFEATTLVGAIERVEQAVQKESWTSAAAALVAVEMELDRLLGVLMFANFRTQPL
jgi:two-component system sensor histidine kinase/response regulator